MLFDIDLIYFSTLLYISLYVIFNALLLISLSSLFNNNISFCLLLLL